MKDFKDFKGIEVVLENCEWFFIPSEYILDIHLEDIKRSFSRIAINASRYMLSSEFIYFGVSNRLARLERLDGMLFCDTEGVNEGEIALDYLANRTDITAVEIITNKFRRKDTYTTVTGGCECSSCKEFPAALERRIDGARDMGVEYFHCPGCSCEHCKEFTEINEVSESIHPDWSPSSEYYNDWQHTIKGEKGDVLTWICSDENAKKYEKAIKYLKETYSDEDHLAYLNRFYDNNY